MRLSRWKLAKTTAISVAILAFAGFAIDAGGDPTVIGGLAISVVGLVAGIEMAELAALGGVTFEND